MMINKSLLKIIQVTIKYVGEVEPESSRYLQFMNIMLRGVLEKLNLDKIGRNFYDSKVQIFLSKNSSKEKKYFKKYELSEIRLSPSCRKNLAQKSLICFLVLGRDQRSQACQSTPGVVSWI